MKTKTFEAALVQYLIDEYFDGDAGKFSGHTEYSKQQIDYWRKGQKKPQKATIRWLLSSTLAPEFRVASEFHPVNFSAAADIRPGITKALGSHKNSSGVYAFYDSVCTVLYIGKASSGFLGEMYQQLRAPLGMSFPNAIKKAPKERWQAVKYVSAYEIPTVEHLDYPKHVESLVLRLSKPIGNKILGKLEKSQPPKDSGRLIKS